MEQKELDGKVWEVSGFVFENEEQAKLAKNFFPTWRLNP